MTNTIRNDKKFRYILPHQEMKPIFGRGIYPQDIDGEVEMDGHFLWLEWKEEGATFDGAQRLATCKRLWLMGNRGTLIVVQHKAKPDFVITPDDVVSFRVARRDRWLQGQLEAIYVSADLYGWIELAKWCRWWAWRTEEKANQFVTRFREALPHTQVIVDLKQRYAT